jgi:CRP-like cAMP-binding protein
MAMSDECIVYRLPAREVAHLAATYGAVRSAIEAHRRHQLHELGTILLDHALFDARARLAHTLARLARRDPEGVVRFSRRELSWLSGLCREDVTRYLGEFQHRALVHFQPRRSEIHVLEVQKLEREGYGVGSTLERSLV